MSPERLLPEFWYPVVRMLLVLRALLMAAAPCGFASISARVHRELRYTSAFVRRYLLALAQSLDLAPVRPRLRAPSPARDARPRRRPIDRPLTLAEPPSLRRPGRKRGPPSSPEIEWGLALQRTDALLAALRRPLPIAHRLARRLARGHRPVLRDLAVPWHIIRALPAALDILLMRLDLLARPSLWTGLDPDTG